MAGRRQALMPCHIFAGTISLIIGRCYSNLSGRKRTVKIAAYRCLHAAVSLPPIRDGPDSAANLYSLQFFRDYYSPANLISGRLFFDPLAPLH